MREQRGSDGRSADLHRASAPALVIGASGQVGRAVLRALGPHAVGTYRTRPEASLRQLDARDARAVLGLVRIGVVGSGR